MIYYQGNPSILKIMVLICPTVPYPKEWDRWDNDISINCLNHDSLD